MEATVSLNASAPRSAPGAPARPSVPDRGLVEVGEGAAIRLLSQTDPQAHLAQTALTLGPALAKGSFHVAHATTTEAGGLRKRAPWIALERVEAEDPALAPWVQQQRRWSKAILENDHNSRVVSAAPEILPRYAGLGILHSKDGTFGQAAFESKLRFVTMWQEKDATFQTIVGAGGLAQGAKLRGQPLTATDVTDGLIQLTAAYRTLHSRGMVYADPKPANLAFDVRPHEVILPPRPSLDLIDPLQLGETNRGSSSRSGLAPGRALSAVKGWLSPEHQVTPPAERAVLTTRISRIAHVAFLDAESMKAPGYATDPTVRADRLATPAWISPSVIRGYSRTDLKAIQADQTTDVYHIAAMGVGLVLGTAPHQNLYLNAIAQESKRRGIEVRQLPRNQVQTLILATRASDPRTSHEAERAELAAAAKQGLIPQALSTALSDGLTGRILSLSGLQRRLEAALPPAQP